MKLKRIQRKGSKGWRMPDGAIYVGRPTIFANPFDWRNFYNFLTESEAKMAAVEYYREWLNGGVDKWSIDRWQILDNLKQLRGKDLACWCKLDEPCHADVLLELANA